MRFTPTRVGKTETRGVTNYDARFTPTRVGKTTGLPVEIASYTVHPHACGENALTWGYRGMGFGSPPRVWGKHQRFNLV